MYAYLRAINTEKKFADYGIMKLLIVNMEYDTEITAGRRRLVFLHASDKDQGATGRKRFCTKCSAIKRLHSA